MEAETKEEHSTEVEVIKAKDKEDEATEDTDK